MRFRFPRILAWASTLALLAVGSQAAAALKAQQVAPGVYAFIGAREDITPANRGNVINSGFIVGPSGVIVVDTGANRRHGEMILSAIRSVTSKPVVLAIDTQAHPENVLGNCAFADRHVPILAQRDAVEAMKQNCEDCYQNLLKILGPEIMQGTRVVIPRNSVDGITEMTVGGRRLRLLHFGWGQTPGDLAVLDLKTGTLFSGGLVFLDRMPVLRQAKIRGWIAALEALRRQPVRVLVPGHGPVSPPRRIDDTLGYLQALLALVEKQYDAGVSVFEVLKHADLPAYRNWALYREVQPLNVQHVYAELENEELDK